LPAGFLVLSLMMSSRDIPSICSALDMARLVARRQRSQGSGRSPARAAGGGSGGGIGFWKLFGLFGEQACVLDDDTPLCERGKRGCLSESPRGRAGSSGPAGFQELDSRANG
jgi:hypothetical protein